MSCENTNRIRFDICSSANSSLRNSNSSSLYYPKTAGRTNTLPVPNLVGSSGPCSLKANGFVPKTTYNSSIVREDPMKWRLSITKQRSQSESTFTTKLLLPSGNSPGSNFCSYHHDEAGILSAVRMAGNGGSSSLSGCPGKVA